MKKSALALLALAALSGSAFCSGHSAVGDKALSFTAKTVDGSTVAFPRDYKGKTVLLYFWASWSKESAAQLPAIAAMYHANKQNNFDVLGVSLDFKETMGAMAKTAKANGLANRQIADGSYWHSALAEKYGVDTLPRIILVDGDTGRVLADSNRVHGGIDQARIFSNRGFHGHYLRIQ